MKWYEKTWVTILTLIFFAPVGIFLMWKYHDWKMVVKIVLSCVSALIFISMITPSGDSDAEQARTAYQQQESPDVDDVDISSIFGEVQIVSHTNFLGEVIGESGLVFADSTLLTEAGLVKFFHSYISGSDMNFFIIDFGDGTGYLFPGSNNNFQHVQLDDERSPTGSARGRSGRVLSDSVFILGDGEYTEPPTLIAPDEIWRHIYDIVTNSIHMGIAFRGDEVFVSRSDDGNIGVAIILGENDYHDGLLSSISASHAADITYAILNEHSYLDDYWSVITLSIYDVGTVSRQQNNAIVDTAIFHGVEVTHRSFDYMEFFHEFNLDFDVLVFEEILANVSSRD